MCLRLSVRQPVSLFVRLPVCLWVCMWTVIVIAKSSFYRDFAFDGYLVESHAMLEVVICIEAIISGTLS